MSVLLQVQNAVALGFAMHPLKRYLREVDEPVRDFAVRVGVSRQTLYRILSGRQSPKPSLARRIVEATGGAVPFRELYFSEDQTDGDLIGYCAGGEGEDLNRDRLKLSIAAVVSHLTMKDDETPDDIAEIAAEAVANTYAALAKVTTRRGRDRLLQALRPVLEEILRETSDVEPTPLMLDQGAQLATRLYYQS